MDQRAIACFDQAMEDVGIAGDEPLRRVLHDYFAWATKTAMARYHRSPDDVPDGMDIPKWSWDGFVTAETVALRKAYAALNRTTLTGSCRYSTRRSNGSNRRAFRQPGPITASKPSKNTSPEAARPGRKVRASRRASSPPATRSS